MMTDTALSTVMSSRPIWGAVKRGLVGRCPNCGKGKMFRAYLKVNDVCPSCSTPFYHQQADDAPPYFTIFIAGHVVVAAMLLVDTLNDNISMGLQMLIWPLFAMILCLVLLPVIKGGLIAYQWAMRMHGFASEPDYPA